MARLAVLPWEERMRVVHWLVLFCVIDGGKSASAALAAHTARARGLPHDVRAARLWQRGVRLAAGFTR